MEVVNSATSCNPVSNWPISICFSARPDNIISTKVYAPVPYYEDEVIEQVYE
ncbi:hypothetical protein DPMN_083535 [Dreissena polymorpha]|uniref:Uncharacterized protein n=1 Tax=Dreissena polymorpha TaxID=45954 RepID=A0A9D3YA28_DREPO|nr:hypothetical protein DPMN_083535 [Dreissena polymorpha]